MPPTGSILGAASVVLNVDDRPATLYLRERILREHGFTVTNADTAHQALEHARHLKPKVILLDVHLPDADGRELCQQLKADPELANIPIVLISATLGGHVDQLECVRWAGADAFLQEPVDREALVSTIRRVIDIAA